MGKKRPPRRRPRTAEDEAFLRNIVEHPNDDAVRLVYADWCEENGDPDRAEFIRLQVERARRPCHDRSKIVPGERESALLAAHRADWLAPLPEHVRGVVAFERGFPGCAWSVELDDFLRWDARLWRIAPLAEVGLNDTEVASGGYRPEGEKEQMVRALADRPELAHLRTLQFNEGSVTAADLAILLASPHLGRLRGLMVTGCALGDEGAALVARATTLPSLVHLILEACGIGPAGATLLADSPLLEQSTTLYLGNNGIEDEGAQRLAASPRMRNLTALTLLGCGLTDAGARALAASPHLGRLAYLCLYVNDIGPSGTAALAERFAGQAVLELVP